MPKMKTSQRNHHAQISRKERFNWPLGQGFKEAANRVSRWPSGKDIFNNSNAFFRHFKVKWESEIQRTIWIREPRYRIRRSSNLWPLRDDLNGNKTGREPPYQSTPSLWKDENNFKNGKVMTIICYPCRWKNPAKGIPPYQI
jgi:hypothetical protein